MMKIIIHTICLSLFTVFSTSAQNDTIWNQENANGEKEGFWRAYHQNGKLRYKGQFKAGKPYGEFYLYLNNGDLKTILVYRNESVVYGKHYYSTGDMLAQGKYVNREKDSIWTTYGAGNIKLEEGPYLLGRKNGPWKVYFPDGKIAESKTYEQDVEEGEYKLFYSNGQLKQRADYINGLMEGKSTFYDREGEKVLEGKYLNNVRHGNWTYYDYGEDGDREVVLKYDKGVLLNPEEKEEIDYDLEEYRENIKDWLEFEDMRGKIEYDEPKEER